MSHAILHLMNVILSHDHTDFDAVASQLGAWKLHPEWTPVLGRYVNQNVRNFLTLHWDVLPFVHDEDLPPNTEIKRAMLVDTQSIPALKGFDTQAIPEICVVDHHELHEETPEGWHVEVEHTGSCTTIFVERIADQGVPISWVEATLLLLGIHEDTGSLVYAGTTPRDVRAAAWLMEQDANLDTLRTFLDHPLNERQRDLYRKLLEGTECLDINGFLVVIASASVERYVDDVSSLAHNLRELYDPAAMVLVAEMGGHVQLVARSTTEEIEMSHLMSEFGGGGHARAAAAFVEDEPLEEVVARLKALLPKYVQPATRVRDLMSTGKIRTFQSNTKIRDAFEAMQRWGHEGFPVLDEGGEVAGVLTRRDVDRALQHDLGGAPVSEFMHKGNIVVTPEDSIARVQRVMTESNIGQVPVVSMDSREIVGIITRTDLLKRMGRVQADTRAQEMIEKLAAALPAPTLRVVRRIAREAHEQDHHPYLVGGIVRDLLLDSLIRDLDIVIEGNAIPVARQLAKQLGGRVVTHERFGTAKWILREPNFPPKDALLEAEELPEHIDLITARTEFYERPTALPQVEHASIKQDLHRRDFTINTLALSLDPEHEGQLLDFYGGLEDLKRGIIRVLHNLSFVEDPTRILRAIRFEQRFGFELEARTKELLLASLDLLEEVSPDRLRHELFLIMMEKHPERILARLDELGILSRLMPDVRWDESDAERFRRLLVAGYEEPLPFITALIWNPTAGPERIDRISAQLGVPKEWQKRLHTIHAIRAHREALTASNLSNSALYAQLQRQDPLALELLAILTDDEVLRRRLRHFLDDLRHRSLSITGETLRESGLPPGPAYQEILDTIHAAMLDGIAPDAEAQRALLEEEVRKRLEART
ncbi:MAG: CBS domain-containing protein [Chloroflexota bacterium]|nr:CBS domain-containing protein [Chloroflexota bacterium]